METENFRNILKSKISFNPLEVLQELHQVFSNNRSSKDAVFNLESRYTRLRTQFNQGILPLTEYNLQLNQIEVALIDLISTINDTEIKDYLFPKAKYHRILVICQDESRLAEMRELFPEVLWKAVEFDSSGTFLAPEFVNTFEILVFDNYMKEPLEHTIALLKYYLTDTLPYVLYFGPYIEWLGKEHHKKAYFANSIFSVHTRLQEMFNYLQDVKTYQPDQSQKNNTQ